MNQSDRHDHEVHFLIIMLELTTAAAFLATSLYGAGQAGITAQTTVKTETATVTETRTFKTQDEVESYLQEQFFDAPILVEIGRCESEFRQYSSNGKVLRGRVDSDDIGVMQINQRYHGETAENMEIDIYTIQGNVAFAKYLYDKYGDKPWSASKPCWGKARELAMK